MNIFKPDMYQPCCSIQRLLLAMWQRNVKFDTLIYAAARFGDTWSRNRRLPSQLLCKLLQFIDRNHIARRLCNSGLERFWTRYRLTKVSFKIVLQDNGWRTLQHCRLCRFLCDVADFGADRNMVRLRTRRKTEDDCRVSSGRPTNEKLASRDISAGIISLCHNASRGTVGDLHLRSSVLCTHHLLLYHLLHRGRHFRADV